MGVLLPLVFVLLAAGGVDGLTTGTVGHAARMLPVASGRARQAHASVSPVISGSHFMQARLENSPRGRGGAGGLRMGFGGVSDHLITYGDVFRQVETLESSLGLDSRKVGTGTLLKTADLASEEREGGKAGKRIGVVSKIGCGVVAALNRVFAGPDSEEVRNNNLETFVACHPGIGLAIEPRPTKRISDIDRLEQCFERCSQRAD